MNSKPQIDRLVYALYGLTPAERDLVEESASVPRGGTAADKGSATK